MAIRLTRCHPREGSAHNKISGFVSTGSTWSESFVIRNQDGDDVIDIDDHSYQFQFRADADDRSAELTLTSSASEITASESGGVTTIAISCAQSRISGMEGDYIADLVTKTGSTLTHRGHGTVTFTKAPVAF